MRMWRDKGNQGIFAANLSFDPEKILSWSPADVDRQKLKKERPMNADFSDIYEKATDYIEIDLPEGVEFLVVDDFSTGEHLTLAAIIEDNEITAQSVVRIIDEDGYCKIACANRSREDCTDPKFVVYNNIPREDAWYFIATSLTKQ